MNWTVVALNESCLPSIPHNSTNGALNQTMSDKHKLSIEAKCYVVHALARYERPRHILAEVKEYLARILSATPDQMIEADVLQFMLVKALRNAKTPE